jgi:CHAD domain-containing protein
MAAETNLEREFKFDVDPGFEAPDLRPVVGRTERLGEQHLTTTYFDTADHRLWDRGITLRHRSATEGDAPAPEPGKWTLKLPVEEEEGAGDSDTDRMARSELTWKASGEEIPAEAAAIVAGLVRRARLERVVVLTTERRRLLLHGTNGAWAEIDDDLVIVSSGSRQGFRFRQIELEMLGDEPEDGTVGPVLRELRRAGAQPGGASKFALAAGLDAARPEPEPATDVPSAVGQIVGADLSRLLQWDYRLRVPDAGGDRAALDVEAVHQARVSVRRLRSDLRALGGLLDPVWLRHVQSDLQWMGRLLGRLRDEDVLAERIEAERGGDDAGTVDELLTVLRSDRHLGATELCDALSSDRYAEMLDRLHAAVEAPPLLAADGENPAGYGLTATLTSIVAARWRVLRTDVDDLGPAPGDDSLHQVRILTKRLRYAAEATEPYLGQPARRVAVAAKRLQSVLGDLHDATSASRTLREMATHPSVTPVVAFAAGRIAGHAEHQAGRLRQEWRKQGKKLWKPKSAGWLV